MADNNQTNISEDDQKRMSKPISNSLGLSEANQKFLDDVISKIEKGQLDPLRPSTLINQQFYSTLSPKSQGQADLSAVNLCSTIREIKTLYDLKYSDSYQMENLVERVRLTKERLENEDGDIFII